MGHLNSYVEKDGNNNILSQSSGVTYDDIYRLTGYNVLYGTNTALTYGFTYLNNDLPSTTTFNGKTVSFTYDDGNKLTNQVNPNNTEDIYTYNDAKQIVGVQTDRVTVTTDPLGNPITTLTSKWTSSSSYNDPDGRLSSVNTSGLINNSANYTYNIGAEKLNRLSHSTIIDGTPGSGTTYNFDYTYDPAGNLLTMAVPNGSGVATNTFTYDSANELATIKVDNNPTTSVLYDANGNLKQLTLNGKTYQYGYDASNHLVSVSDGTNTTAYTYGQDGQRLTKTTNGVTITYHYVNGQLAFETSSADASNPNLIHALYVRSPQGKLLAVSLNYTIGGSNNYYYYYHYNAQGDVVAVTDSTGAVYRQYVYDPYGNVISVKDGSGTSVDINNDAGFNNAYTYRGYRYDSETGLYFLNSRYYAAGIGRFLTKNIILGHLSDPQTLDRYAYCGGDPVNYVDPTGYYEDETGDPNHPFVTPRAGQADTGKLEFSNNSSIGMQASLGRYGEPNSVGREYDKNGNLTKERWYGPDGRAIKDKHYTDHGNPKQYPKVPHEHDWGFNEDGEWTPGPWYISPSSDMGKGILVAGASIGAGYLAYRGVRMIPSLFPALWWTIPINAAYP